MRFTICLVALAATVASGPVFAQAVATDSDTAVARGTVLGNHSLRKQTDLDFGVVTVDPALSGTVSIAADASGSRTTGGAGGVTPLASTFQAAKFAGSAAPNETVALSLTPPPGGIVIDGAGNNIPVTLVLDTAGTPRKADPSGGFTVYVGGTFSLLAAQPAGVYSGQFSLTATYQ